MMLHTNKYQSQKKSLKLFRPLKLVAIVEQVQRCKRQQRWAHALHFHGNFQWKSLEIFAHLNYTFISNEDAQAS